MLFPRNGSLRTIRIPVGLLLLLAVAGAGCSTGNTSSSGASGATVNHIAAPGASVPGWFVLPTGGSHGGTATLNFIANDGTSSCAECHGADLSGGISKVSCFANPAGCHHGPIPNWAGGAVHGAVAKKAPGNSGLASCQICHGAGFSGGGSGVSCFTCHGVSAPHPAKPWRSDVGSVHPRHHRSPERAGLRAVSRPGILEQPGGPSVHARPGGDRARLLQQHAVPRRGDGAARAGGDLGQRHQQRVPRADRQAGPQILPGLPRHVGDDAVQRRGRVDLLPVRHLPSRRPRRTRPAGTRRPCRSPGTLHRTGTPGIWACRAPSATRWTGPGRGWTTPPRAATPIRTTGSPATPAAPAARTTPFRSLERPTPRRIRPASTATARPATPFRVPRPSRRRPSARCATSPRPRSRSRTAPRATPSRLRGPPTRTSPARTPSTTRWPASRECAPPATTTSTPGTSGHYDRANAVPGKDALRVVPRRRGVPDGLQREGRVRLLRQRRPHVRQRELPRRGRRAQLADRDHRVNTDAGCRRATSWARRRGLPRTTAPSRVSTASHLSPPGRSMATCTDCHNMANGTTGATNHFKFLNTPQMEGPASQTVEPGGSPANYNATNQTCTVNLPHRAAHQLLLAGWGEPREAVPGHGPHHGEPGRLRRQLRVVPRGHGIVPGRIGAVLHGVPHVRDRAALHELHLVPRQAAGGDDLPGHRRKARQARRLASVTGVCGPCHTGPGQREPGALRPGQRADGGTRCASRRATWRSSPPSTRRRGPLRSAAPPSPAPT